MTDRRRDCYRYLMWNPAWLQLQQYKISGHPPKAIEDRPKENGQADEGQQQNKVSKTNAIF